MSMLRSTAVTAAIFLIFFFYAVNSKFTEQQVENYIEEAQCGSFTTSLIGTGAMKGLFSLAEVWDLHAILRSNYPKAISEQFTLGQTVQGNPIEGFFIGADTGDDEHKNIVLIDSMHHAREFVTLSMIVQIIADSVKEVVKCSDEFFLNNRLLIIPAINIDSVLEISKHFQDSTWPMKQKIRKNMKPSGDCHGIENGVDLNRNYDFEFDKIKQGEPRNPCSDEYIGTAPFSEPETKAVRDTIDQHSNIVSALNFHSYANVWVRPYSYSHNSNSDSLKQKDPRLWRLYKDFERFSREKAGRIRFGTAIDLVKYIATGEASDWMLNKRGIFAWSPELGCDKSGCDSFYPREEAQKLTIHNHYPIVKSFLDFHKPKFEYLNSTLIRNRKFGALGDRIETKLVTELFFPSPSHLHQVQIRIELPNGLVPDKVKIFVSKLRKQSLLKSDRSLKPEKFSTLFGGIMLNRNFEIKRRHFVYVSVTVSKKELFQDYKIQFIRNDTILAEFVKKYGIQEKQTQLII